MSFLLWLAIRFVQGCVFGAYVAEKLGADPEHPVIRRMRAVAKPFLDFVRPLARKLPGPLAWTSMAIVVCGLDVLRWILGV